MTGQTGRVAALFRVALGSSGDHVPGNITKRMEGIPVMALRTMNKSAPRIRAQLIVSYLTGVSGRSARHRASTRVSPLVDTLVSGLSLAMLQTEVFLALIAKRRTSRSVHCLHVLFTASGQIGLIGVCAPERATVDRRVDTALNASALCMEGALVWEPPLKSKFVMLTVVLSIASIPTGQSGLAATKPVEVERNSQQDL